MKKVTELIKNVKKNLTDEEIHNLFVNRLDEEMFAQVGYASMTGEMCKKIQAEKREHLYAWQGYELLRGM